MTSFSTTNLTRIGPRLKMILCGERPAINRLKHGTTFQDLVYPDLQALSDWRHHRHRTAHT